MINGTSYRITSQIADQQRLSQSINDLQTQISTGQRLSSPSDDPAAYARIAAIRRNSADAIVAQAGIAQGSTLAAQADTAIGSMQQLVDLAKETLLAAASGTNSGETRILSASALRGIANDIRNLVDTRDQSGSPIFSQAQGRTIPIGNETIEIAPSRQAFFQLGGAGQPADIAEAIVQAADRLEAGARQTDYAATSDLAIFDQAAGKLASARADVGFTGQRLEKLSARYEARTLDLTLEKSSLADTDVSEAIARINAQQISLQAAQAMFARLNQAGLFELLR